MTLVRFNPWSEIDSLSNQIQKHFDGTDLSFNFGSLFSPKINMYEEGDNLIVDTELGGFSKDELTLKLQENVLTISGEKKKEEEKKDRTYYRREKNYNSFSRSISLPVEVEINSVKADYESGLLKITMKKYIDENKKERTIKVQ